MPEPLFLEERRRAIMERLEQEGRVTVKDLSDQMQVSEVTIRQDLRALEDQGLLDRTYGGAVYKGSPLSSRELSFNVRMARMSKHKKALAEYCAQYIENGFSIALDCSTTVYALVPFIKQLDKFTIVTNGLIAAQSFLESDEQQVDVLIPGGRLRKDSISTVGQPEDLPNINLNIGFFSGHGITAGIGITEVDKDEVLMKQALMARCIHLVFVVDGSKWGRVAPYTIISSADLVGKHLITTEGAPEDQVKKMREMGVRVDVLPVKL